MRLYLSKKLLLQLCRKNDCQHSVEHNLLSMLPHRQDQLSRPKQEKVFNQANSFHINQLSQHLDKIFSTISRLKPSSVLHNSKQHLFHEERRQPTPSQHQLLHLFRLEIDSSCSKHLFQTFRSFFYRHAMTRPITQHRLLPSTL